MNDVNDTDFDRLTGTAAQILGTDNAAPGCTNYIIPVYIYLPKIQR